MSEVAANAALEVADVHLRRGARAILAGVSATVPRGSIVALMGPSGSGKTTMLRAIAALERFDAGTISIDGVSIAGGESPAPATVRQLRSRVGLVFQFHYLFEHLTALANVTLAPVHVHGVAPDVAATRAMELLQTFGVEHRARALPRELSGGEAQRVAIARALAVDPPLLMMDEPTASLDPERREELAGLLKHLAGQGRAILVSTHDDDFARGCANAVLQLREGRVSNGR